MANSDKNIRITANRDTQALPKIIFTGQSNNPIALNVLDDNTISFEGSAGQLFSINNNLSSGYIFSINDISGIPSFRVNADGTVGIAEFLGNVGIGLTNPAYKLQISGSAGISGTANISGVLTLSSTTGSGSTSTGALVVSGGVGIGGSIFSSTAYASNISGVIFNNGAITSSGALTITNSSVNAFSVRDGSNSSKFNVDTVAGIISVLSSTASTSTSTGALVVSGGVGIGQSVNIGGRVGIGTVPNLSMLNIQTSSAGTTGLSISASTSQSANLFEWYADGGVGGGYSLSGRIRPSGHVNLGNPGTINMSTGTSALLSLQGRGSTEGLAIRGFNSAAFEPLFEIQGNPGNQLFGIYGDGGVNAPRINVTNSTGSTSTSSGALIVTGGVGIGNSLFVNGRVDAGNFKAWVENRTLSTTDTCVGIGTFFINHGAHNILISLNVSDAGYSAAKNYTLTSNWNIGGWSIVAPLSSTGSYSNNNFQLEAYQGSGSLTLRARSLGSGGSLKIYVQNVGQNTATFTAYNSATSETAITTYHPYAFISQENNVFKINSSTASTSTSTGALVVVGGVGIGGSLYVASATAISGVTINAGVITGSLTGTASTATYSHQSGYAITSGTATTATYAFQSGYGITAGLATTATYAHQSGYAITSGSSGSATTANNINVANALTNSAHTLLFSPTATGSGVAVSSNTTLSYNPSSFVLSTSGLAITATTASSSTSNGALQVAGGVGISGRLSFNQAAFGTTGIATNPTMAMIGNTGDPIFLSILEDNTISFEGSQGQLFSITPNLSTGYIYSVNDITGIPLLRANANANVTANEYAGNFGIGLSNPGYKLHVVGSVGFTSTTASTSTTTGTLVVSGGVGIGGSLNVNSASNISNVIINNGVITGNLTGTATTSGFATTASYSNQAGYAITAGSATTATYSHQAGYAITAGSATTASYSDQSGFATTASYAYQSGYGLTSGFATTASYSHQAGYATTAGSATTAVTAVSTTTVSVSSAGSSNLAHQILITNNPSSGSAVSSDSTFTFNPSTEILSVSGISVTSTTASTSYDSGALVVTGGVGIGGSLFVNGDFTINGTTTTINSVTLSVDDKNIELGSVSSPSDVTAEGGGITLKGATDKFINWYSGVGWSSSESWNLVSGNSYKINNASVLTSTTLGTGVTNSSLTSLGTITTGVWAGTLITANYGGVGLTTPFTVGDILYANTSTTWDRLAAGTSGHLLSSTGTGSTPSYVNPNTLTVGSATTASNLRIAVASSNLSHPVLFTPGSSTSGSAVSSDSTFSFNSSTEILSVSGLAITSTTSSSGSTTGALTVAGGVGIGGTVNIAGDETVLGRLYYSQSTVGVAGTSTIPSISFIGQDNNPITLSVLTDNTLSFEGSSGQLFSINNNLSSGTIFSVNDISGIPIIRANANGTLSMGEFTGTVGVGLTNPSFKFHVSGSAGFSGTIYATGNVSLASNTDSTSTTNGALTVAGGVGIGGSLYVASATAISGVTINAGVITGSLTGLATTATYSHQSGYAITSGFATTATNINVVSALTSANHPILFTPTSGSASGVAVSTENSFVYNPSTDILSVSGISITSSTASTSTSTGALIVSGGVGIGQSVNIGGRVGIGTNLLNAALNITTPSASVSGLIIQGSTSQSASFVKINSSIGGSFFEITNTGIVNIKTSTAGDYNSVPLQRWYNESNSITGVFQKGGFLYTGAGLGYVDGTGTQTLVHQWVPASNYYVTNWSKRMANGSSVQFASSAGGDVRISGDSNGSLTFTSLGTYTGNTMVKLKDPNYGTNQALLGIVTQDGSYTRSQLFSYGNLSINMTVAGSAGTDWDTTNVIRANIYTKTKYLGNLAVLAVDDTNRFTVGPYGNTTVSLGGTTVSTGLIIKATSSQTGNLFEAQSSTGSTIAYIDSSGSIYSTGVMSISNSSTTAFSVKDGSNNTKFNVDTIGGIVSVSSSTASTNTSTGALTVTGGVGIGQSVNIGGRVGIGTNLLTGQINIRNSASSVPSIVIQGATSQSEDYLRVMSSTGTTSFLLNSSYQFAWPSIGTLKVYGTSYSSSGRLQIDGCLSVGTGPFLVNTNGTEASMTSSGISFGGGAIGWGQYSGTTMSTGNPVRIGPTSSYTYGLWINAENGWSSGNLLRLSNNGSYVFNVDYSGITNIYSTAGSASTTTGALIVSGGVGIGQTLFTSASYASSVSGVILSNGTVTGNLTGTATTATYAHQAGFATSATSASIANTSYSVNVNAASANASHFLIFSPTATGSGVALSSESALVYNPSADILSVSGLAVTSGTASTSATTGALIVTGGVGIGQTLTVGLGISTPSVSAPASLIIKPGVDSTTGIQLTRSSSAIPVINIDTLNSRVGIGLTNPEFDFEVNGSISATTKSFVIEHPTKQGMKLRYGSLEGPENGVYVRGELKDNNTIILPDYWSELIDEFSITVHLTPIGNKFVYVKEIKKDSIIVGSMFFQKIHCYYSVWAERKDVPKLKVEF